MKPGSLMRLAVGAVFGMGLSSTPGAAAEGPPVIRAFERTDTAPHISRESAIKRAADITGLKAAPASVEHGLATDTSIPFSDVKVLKRPAWKVEFEQIEILAKNREGVLQKNPNISSITVLIDSENGAVLKVFSPERGLGGVLEWPAKQLELYLSGSGVLLQTARQVPTVPFMKALSIASDRLGRFAPQAKEVVAFFGLMTDILRLRIDNKVVDRPFWIIIAGGLHLPGFSVPPGYTGPALYVRQAWVAVDAESGEWYRGGNTGAGN